ncbi:hypothetical protein EYC80_004071 [Monilinia laxa]|uniref:Uncharacterized protein n=1 Tax=Monilinia laxa TaxID=61186 RepID=A0A5N6KM68_MONLA|nr:hypothetical protein EYC80_004071 [Monilinia laxa]
MIPLDYLNQTLLHRSPNNGLQDSHLIHDSSSISNLTIPEATHPSLTLIVILNRHFFFPFLKITLLIPINNTLLYNNLAYDSRRISFFSLHNFDNLIRFRDILIALLALQSSLRKHGGLDPQYTLPIRSLLFFRVPISSSRTWACCSFNTSHFILLRYFLWVLVFRLALYFYSFSNGSDIKLGFARDIKNVWLARKTTVFLSLVFFARVAYRLCWLYYSCFLGLFWCVTLVFLERKGRCYLPRGLGTPRGLFVHDGILDFDEPVGLVCLYWKKDLLLPCILYYSFKAFTLLLLVLHSDLSCLFAKRVRSDLLYLVYPGE